MIAICKLELDWLDMKVNVLKSSGIRVGPQFDATQCIINIGLDKIEWSAEIKYLGLFLVAGKRFACNLHSCKIKFFRALNAILSKIGDMNAITVILSIISSNCIPILMYGLEAMQLTKTQCNRLRYAYNSVFYKLFHSFNDGIIMQTQYYTSFLNLECQIDLRTINFLNKLRTYNVLYPAAHLFYVCGSHEWTDIATKYHINYDDTATQCRSKIWSTFAHTIAALP